MTGLTNCKHGMAVGFEAARKLILVFSILLLGSCTSPPSMPDVPSAQRLVDTFQAEWIDGGPGQQTELPHPTELRFDGSPSQPAAQWPETRGWEPGSGVKDLAISDGRLTGRTTNGFATLHRVLVPATGDLDQLHEIRVRMKVSAGAKASIHLVGRQGDLFDNGLVDDPNMPFLLNAPIQANSMQDYAFTPAWTVSADDCHNIYLRPSDVGGADFEIESVRLVFRREFMASMPSGVGWEGLDNLYKETVIARSPEVISWPLTLPARPRLTLSVGTPDEQPVTFTVTAEPGDQPSQSLLRRTVTSRGRWENLAIDLDEFAGRDVTLRLALVADRPGSLGLWGTPVVRDRFADDPPAGQPTPSETPQGVILVLADTLRADHLECYGYQRETMPEISRLASQGALFRDVQAQGAWTKVSVPSLLSALYPSTSGVRSFQDRLPSSATTLAEAFRQAGYSTMGLSSVSFTGRASNLHQGFEELLESRGIGGRDDTSRDFVDRTVAWLEDHSSERFFISLHIFDPHNPYDPEPANRSRWTESDWQQDRRLAKQRILPFIDHPVRRIEAMATRDEVLAAGDDPSAFIEREMALYDASIRDMDQELGRLIERLRELGLHDKTLIAFTSDHGEEFFDHGQMSHGHTAHNELTHVPLVLWYPQQIAAGTEVDETVQLIDVMPSILELASIPLPAGIQGQSVVPLLAPGKESKWQPRPAITERPPMAVPQNPPQPAQETTALVFEGWKLLHHHDPRPGVAEFELYDHQSDPLEQTDLAAENPQEVARLAELMAVWRAEAEAARLSADPEAGPELTQQEKDHLRALGYITDASPD